MSAVLLPYTADGEIDWAAVEAHIARTAEAGLTPAVNMDTGYVQLLAAAEAAPRARPRRRGDRRALRRRRVRRRRSRRRASTSTPTRAATDAVRGTGRHAGRVPVARPQRAARGTAGWPRSPPSAPSVDRFIGFELGAMFVPYGRIFSLDAYRAMLEIPQCIGAKHSSLSRRAEWERLAVRDEVRPDFRVLTGNDLAIDMVMYGSDYLLGLSTFAPEAFAARDRLWEAGDPALPRAQRPAAVPRASSRSGRRCPPTGTTRRCSSQLRGWASSDVTPPGAPRRPESDRRRPRRHRRPPRTRSCEDHPGQEARHGSRPSSPTSTGSASSSRSTTQVDPQGALASHARDRRRLGRDARPCRTASRSCPWRAGTARPTGARPTSCAAGGGASAPAAAASCGARRPRSDPTAGPTRTSSCSDETTVDDLAALRALPRPGPGRRPAAHPLRPLRPTRGSARAAHRLRHPVLDARGRRRRPPTCSATTSSTSWSSSTSTRRCWPARPASTSSTSSTATATCCTSCSAPTTGPGRYGGDLAGRTHFLRSVVAGIRARAPDARRSPCGCRCSTSCRSAPAPTASGSPTRGGPYRYAFGGDGTGLGIDLTETHALLDLLEQLGIGLVGTTAGSPYYNPHVQRPAYFPPSDGYQPPEDPLVGVARQLAATAELDRRPPAPRRRRRGLLVPPGVAAQRRPGRRRLAAARRWSGSAAWCSRYPDLAADVLAGRPLQTALVCRTFSDCTTAPRNGLVSGCFPLDPFYKEHPQRVELARAKKEAKSSRG